MGFIVTYPPPLVRWLSRGLGALLALLLGLSATAGLLEDMGINSDTSKESTQYTCVPKPPPPRPAQHSGGEGVPPLPLPAVPLRRTEKKNPPRPPVLIAKIATQQKEDWATNPSDADNLLRWMSEKLQVNFSTTNIPANQVPSDPREVPILYRTGHLAFEFTPEMRQKLRAYLLGGGTMIFDACCGRPDFAVSAYKEMQGLLPERSPYRLAADHPMMRAYYEIQNIHYRPTAVKAGAKQGDPAIIGLDVGCRTAVFFFRWDISCGWDNLEDSADHKCMGYDLETSRVIGANLMAYITSERNSAVPLSKALAYVDEGREAAGKFVIAQAVYEGTWRTRESGLSMLLNTFHDKTLAPVRFERKVVELGKNEVFDVPFIYLTGHEDFTLKDQERDNLQRFIKRGGVVFAEACCGRAGFDTAFRREIAKVLGDVKMEPLPPDHLIYRYPNVIQSVTPRPALARELKANRLPPPLMGARVDGHLGVIYSPVGLACGWELAQCPYCRGIESNDALALGVNVLSYILTQ
jgi:hypothetical protein